MVIISVAVGAVTARRVVMLPTFLSDAHATAENHHSRYFLTDIKGEQILLHQMSIVLQVTAITISAPNARVSEIGIGLTQRHQPASSRYAQRVPLVLESA